MRASFSAYGVHLITATGAVLALCALVAAAAGDWRAMFLWLLAALLLDGIDGPLARRLEVSRRAPVIDGTLLDLIVDYLTYVFVPVFALVTSAVLPGPAGWIAALVICFGSALYFADTRMKTADRSFRGFPACWNMVVLGIFAVQPQQWFTLAVVIALAVLMFLPLRFVHPLRTARWRPLTLIVTATWAVCAVYAVAVDFAPGAVVVWGVIVTSVYLLVAGGMQQLLDRRRTRAPRAASALD